MGTEVTIDSSNAPESETTPVPLTIKGKHLKSQEPWTELFLLAPRLPPTAVGPLITSFNRNPETGELMANVGAMVNFVDRLLLDGEDRERWYDVVNDPARLIREEDLGEAIEALVENDLIRVPFGLPGGWRVSSPLPTSVSTSEASSSAPAETPTPSPSESGSNTGTPEQLTPPDPKTSPDSPTTSGGQPTADPSGTTGPNPSE